MAQKLWEKSVQVNKEIERFTVGRDREMDLYLAKHDVLGSMAHITMLQSIGLLTEDELKQLLAELRKIHAQAEQGNFVIEEGVEDVHSQVELMLTRSLGNVGKKIHSGRSRNDQVLLDLKLFTRYFLNVRCIYTWSFSPFRNRRLVKKIQKYLFGFQFFCIMPSNIIPTVVMVIPSRKNFSGLFECLIFGFICKFFIFGFQFIHIIHCFSCQFQRLLNKFVW